MNHKFSNKLNQSEALKYCKYYKGEKECPSELNETERQIWVAEKMICCHSDMIGSDNPERDLVSYVASYVGKWDPWEYRDVINYYLKRFEDPTLVASISRVYEL